MGGTDGVYVLISCLLFTWVCWVHVVGTCGAHVIVGLGVGSFLFCCARGCVGGRRVVWGIGRVCGTCASMRVKGVGVHWGWAMCCTMVIVVCLVESVGCDGSGSCLVASGGPNVVSGGCVGGCGVGGFWVGVGLGSWEGWEASECWEGGRVGGLEVVEVGVWGVGSSVVGVMVGGDGSVGGGGLLALLCVAGELFGWCGGLRLCVCTVVCGVL